MSQTTSDECLSQPSPARPYDRGFRIGRSFAIASLPGSSAPEPWISGRTTSRTTASA
jgi:hypothetical protein